MDPSRQYVLDYVLERKSIADLVSSITEGKQRYLHQKYFLNKCGIAHCIYLQVRHARLGGCAVPAAVSRGPECLWVPGCGCCAVWACCGCHCFALALGPWMCLHGASALV